MKKLTLVILAAGMGSRYGGLKQLDNMTDEGDTIIDFSIYDAIEAGFTKIIFVIRNSFKEEFEGIFNAKLKDKVEILYVYQELDNIPKNYINANRKKPWGTGHALLMTKDVISENFAIINADDFYGRESFKLMAEKLKTTSLNTTNFYMAGYQLKNTISKYGSVSRGQCYVDKEGFLKKIIERTHIEKISKNIFYKDKDNSFIKINEDTPVSMNFWGFTPTIFCFLEEEFNRFLYLNNSHLKKEFFIPLAIDNLIEQKKVKVSVLNSNAKWLGVTYREDKLNVVKEIRQLKQKGIYPKLLW